MGWGEQEVHLRAVVLRSEPTPQPPGRPHYRAADSVGLAWGLRIVSLISRVIPMLLVQSWDPL